MQNENFLDNLRELSKIISESLDKIEQEQEDYWASLSKDDQLKAFCCVIRRIYQGELIDKGSYRHILYETFGFDLESYMQAQRAGYIEIHNLLGKNDAEN